MAISSAAFRPAGACARGAPRREADFSAVSGAGHEAVQWHTHRTQRELAEAHRSLSERLHQLRLAAGYMESFIDPLEVGIVAVDGDGRVMIVNRAAERLFGVKRERLVGRSLAALEARLTPSVSVTRAMQRRRPPAPVRRVVLRDDGSQCLVETSLSLLHEGDEVIGAVLVLKDLSPIQELERRLHHAEQLAAIGKVAAALAHDVRSPVAVIEGFGQLLLQHLPQSDPCRRYAESILKAAAHLNQAVAGTLILARDPRLELSDIAPLALLEEVKQLIVRETEGVGLSDIEVRVEAALDAPGEPGDPIPPPRILGDREQLIRALMNLCRNAVEAMPSGGRLTLRLSPSPCAAADRPFVRLSVEDTGIGVPPEIRRRLFDPFETTKEEGIGLGLAIVKKVADLHGGSVSFETRAGKGTAFHMDLPAT